MTSHGGAKLGSLGAVLLTLGTAFACTVEDNLPIGDWVGGTGAAGAGGSAGSGGTAGAGGSGTAGSAGTAGTGTTAGSGASLDVGCDYVTVLNSNCARSACHNERSAVADFNLTPTSPDGSPEGLIARLKDQPARHREIDCGNRVNELLEAGLGRGIEGIRAGS